LLPFNKDLIQNALVVDKEWAPTEWTLRRTARTHRFWALCCFNFLAGLGFIMVVTHKIRFAVDVGSSKMLAASAFGLYGIANVAGHALGFLSDRLGREFTCSIGSAGAILATLILMEVENFHQL
jgi:MFS family permease